MGNITRIPTKHQDSDQEMVDRHLSELLHLPHLPPKFRPKKSEIQEKVDALTAPVNRVWLLGRIAATLSAYYEKDSHHSIEGKRAEDWLQELQEYPQWAIERAMRWWTSSGNKDRRKQPLEGDIAERCLLEMKGIKSLPWVLERKEKEHQAQQQSRSRPQITQAQREENKIAIDEALSRFGIKSQDPQKRPVQAQHDASALVPYKN